LRLTVDFEPDGEVPKPIELVALCLTVQSSSRLTPQQNENEVLKRYPRGYKSDRELANKLSKLLLMSLLKQGMVDRSKMDMFKGWIEVQTEQDPNRQQRDLLEVGEDAAGFFHDNEHQYRATMHPRSPWVGNRPKMPVELPWDKEWDDPALKEVVSDGEDFEEVHFGEREQVFDDIQEQSMDMDED
jgi:hypothetical protein